MEFAKYYDVTKKIKDKIMAESELTGYKDYKGLYVCKDVHSFWICRVLEDMNNKYKRQPGKYLIERNLIEKEELIEYLEKKNNCEYNISNREQRDVFIDRMTKVKTIYNLFELDAINGLENWDTFSCDSFEECLEAIDGGFGILKW